MDNKELDNLKKNITMAMKGESVDGTLGYVLEETDFENVAEIIVNLLPIHSVSDPVKEAYQQGFNDGSSAAADSIAANPERL
tara:strand:+ start:732 stop:977 length:246 start_codon:yes stop_codon:yes gene_type:complete